ncbi:hypothetical protein GCM10027189_34520 [Rufibacter soli]
MRGGKTGPRGRERSEGNYATEKHKGLRQEQAPRQQQAERRAQIQTIATSEMPYLKEKNTKRIKPTQ